jgi:hypothetical protein
MNEQDQPTTRATETQLATLHNLVTTELTERVKLGREASTADLKAAIDWLAKNNITGAVVEDSPLASLIAEVTQEEEEAILQQFRS